MYVYIYDGSYFMKGDDVARASRTLLEVFVALVICPLVCGRFIGNLIHDQGRFLTLENTSLLALVLTAGIYAGRPLCKKLPQATIKRSAAYEAVRELVQNGHNSVLFIKNERVVSLALAYDKGIASIVRQDWKMSGRKKSSAYLIYAVQADGKISKFTAPIWRHLPTILADPLMWRCATISVGEMNDLLAILRTNAPRQLVRQ